MGCVTTAIRAEPSFAGWNETAANIPSGRSAVVPKAISGAHCGTIARNPQSGQLQLLSMNATDAVVLSTRDGEDWEAAPVSRENLSAWQGAAVFANPVTKQMQLFGLVNEADRYRITRATARNTDGTAFGSMETVGGGSLGNASEIPFGLNVTVSNLLALRDGRTLLLFTTSLSQNWSTDVSAHTGANGVLRSTVRRLRY